MHWRDEYELHADRERRAADAVPVKTLLENVQQGRYGNYYVVWYSIGERASIETAGWILFDVLYRDIDYLYRYHCAAALIRLLATPQFRPVELSSDRPGRSSNLDEVGRLLAARLGARPRDHPGAGHAWS